jgi:hypothetical protein
LPRRGAVKVSWPGRGGVVVGIGRSVMARPSLSAGRGPSRTSTCHVHVVPSSTEPLFEYSGCVAVQLAPSPPTLLQCQVASLLYAGPRSWLAGTTAASVLGFIPAEPHARVHVLAPPTVKPRTLQWVTIRRTYLLDERLVEKGPLRLSCRPRAVMDAAALLPDDTARGLLIDMVRQRLVRLDDLTHWVEARETTGRPRLRALLHEAAAGAWSVPEADLATLVRSSHVLPGAMLNPALKDMRDKRLTTPDVWFDDVGMAVMVHSRQFPFGLPAVGRHGHRRLRPVRLSHRRGRRDA